MLAWEKKWRRSLKTGHEWFIQSKRAIKVVLTYGYVFKEKYICTMRLRAYNISELQYSEMTDETAEDAPPAGLVTASSKCLFEFYLKPKPAGVQPLHLLICPHEWREEQGTTLGSQVWNVLTSVWARRRLGSVYSCGHYSTHRLV